MAIQKEISGGALPARGLLACEWTETVVEWKDLEPADDGPLLGGTEIRLAEKF